jgi:hypothetical protein
VFYGKTNGALLFLEVLETINASGFISPGFEEIGKQGRTQQLLPVRQEVNRYDRSSACTLVRQG